MTPIAGIWVIGAIILGMFVLFPDSDPRNNSGDHIGLRGKE